jgi:predicted transcriptional regulator
MKSTDQVLEIVGNVTRRKILGLLSEEPNYVSQIAKKLNVTQPAILKHLDLLQATGLIGSFWKKNPLGAARKYYKIRDSVDIEIAINPRKFKITSQPRTMSCTKYLEIEEAIGKLTDDMNKAKTMTAKIAKAQELMRVADSLLSCSLYRLDNWNCENCHRIATLRKKASQIVVHVSNGEIEAGLRKLTEAINQLVAGLHQMRRNE